MKLNVNNFVEERKFPKLFQDSLLYLLFVSFLIRQETYYLNCYYCIPNYINQIVDVQVFMIWYYFHPHANELYNNFWHVWRIIGFVLTFVNSCLNPVALCIISGVFRSHFKHYILWCFYKDIRREQSITLLRLRSANSVDCHSAKMNQMHNNI